MSAEPAPRGDSLLSTRAKEAGRTALIPLVRVLIALGIGPNTVTLAGLAMVLLGAVLIATGSLLAGAIVLAVGAAFDALDGGLARARGGGTAFGAFLDSTLDRTGEAVAYVAIMAYYLGGTEEPAMPVMVAALALSGSFLVSYSRARAEAGGFTASNGLAPRTERLIILVLGLAIAGLGYPIALLVAMGLIAILAWVTVTQRIWNVHRQAAEAAGRTHIGQDKES